MKMPKELRTRCPNCKKHTLHKVHRVKKGRASSLTRIQRQRKRAQGIGNIGKFNKVPGGDKPTKRVNLMVTCSVCHKSHARKGFRVKRFELEEV